MAANKMLGTSIILYAIAQYTGHVSSEKPFRNVRDSSFFGFNSLNIFI